MLSKTINDNVENRIVTILDDHEHPRPHDASVGGGDTAADSGRPVLPHVSAIKRDATKPESKEDEEREESPVETRFKEGTTIANDSAGAKTAFRTKNFNTSLDPNTNKVGSSTR